MIVEKKIKYKPVLIIWKDAHADGNGWTSLSEVDDSPCLVRSVGFLVPKRKKNHLTLAQSLIHNDTIADHIIHIPEEMVVSVTDLH